MPRLRPALLPAQGAAQVGLAPSRRVRAPWARAAPALALSAALLAAALTAAARLLGAPPLPPPAPLGHSAVLKAALDTIVAEATRTARELHILTETDAAEAAAARAAAPPPEDWSCLLDDAGAAAAAPPACARDADCAPHGACTRGACACATAYSGRLCGHGALLTWPATPAGGAAPADLGFYGRLAAPAHGAAASAAAAALRRLRGACAVVAASPALAPGAGAAVDAHDAVFRIGAAPASPARAGSRTAVRVVARATDCAAAADEACLVVGDGDGGAALAAHADLRAHVAAVFGADAGPAAYAAALALQACRRVTLFGFVYPPGVGGTYAAPCASAESADSGRRRRAVAARALAGAGLVVLGGECDAECAAEGGGAACERCRRKRGLAAPGGLPPCGAADDYT
jgi:hypothetical protein